MQLFVVVGVVVEIHDPDPDPDPEHREVAPNCTLPRED
jgi:hypothetical protein